MKVAVIGLGRVGLPLALFCESLGMKVIGIDRDKGMVDGLRKKIMPFHEEGCDELLRARGRAVGDEQSEPAGEERQVAHLLEAARQLHVAEIGEDRPDAARARRRAVRGPYAQDIPQPREEHDLAIHHLEGGDPRSLGPPRRYR